jgi:hypothetical protein
VVVRGFVAVGLDVTFADAGAGVDPGFSEGLDPAPNKSPGGAAPSAERFADRAVRKVR